MDLRGQWHFNNISLDFRRWRNSYRKFTGSGPPGKSLTNINNSASVIRTALSRNGETIVSSGTNQLNIFDPEGNLLGKDVEQGAIWDVAISSDGITVPRLSISDGGHGKEKLWSLTGMVRRSWIFLQKARESALQFPTTEARLSVSMITISTECSGMESSVEFCQQSPIPGCSCYRGREIYCSPVHSIISGFLTRRVLFCGRIRKRAMCIAWQFRKMGIILLQVLQIRSVCSINTEICSGTMIRGHLTLLHQKMGTTSPWERMMKLIVLQQMG